MKQKIVPLPFVLKSGFGRCNPFCNLHLTACVDNRQTAASVQNLGDLGPEQATNNTLRKFFDPTLARNDVDRGNM